jgi:uncharacterized membrane protein
MIKKASWILLGLFAVLVGLYPGIYFVEDRKFGLLSSKTDFLLGNVFWNIGFYTHIVFGGVALLVGWIQFSSSLRNKHLQLHRFIGKIYVVAALLSSLAGIGIGIFATGGRQAALGFVCLGITWFTTTLVAYIYIRHMQVQQHRKMMIYSYAACFAAVTLRLWLPLLSAWLGDFTTAYRIVAWLCWVPNLFVANLIYRRFHSEG